MYLIIQGLTICELELKVAICELELKGRNSTIINLDNMLTTILASNGIWRTFYWTLEFR